MLEMRANISEHRFFEAVWSPRYTSKPSWFKGIVQASPILDRRGIDAIAYVQYPGQTMFERVPVQIKATRLEALNERSRRQEYCLIPIPIVVANSYMKDRRIRLELFETIKSCRADGKKFADMLSTLETTPLTERDRPVYEMIVLERRTNPIVPPGEAIRRTRRWKRLAASTYLTTRANRPIASRLRFPYARHFAGHLR